MNFEEAKATLYEGITDFYDILIEDVEEEISKSIDEILSAEESLRTIIDNMPLVCNIGSGDLKILECNEEAVKLFLDGKIKFTQISGIIERAMRINVNSNHVTLENILSVADEVAGNIKDMF